MSISSVCRLAVSKSTCLPLTSRKLVWAARTVASFSSMRPPPPMIRAFSPFSWVAPPPLPPCGARRRLMCSRWMTFCCSSRSFFSSIAFSAFRSLLACALAPCAFRSDASFCCVVVLRCSIFRSSKSALALWRASSPPLRRDCRSLVTRSMCTSFVRSSMSVVCMASILYSHWMKLSFLRNSLMVSKVPVLSFPSSKMRRLRDSTTSLSITMASE
mmetsp:Transcript_10797/g.27824  ORF Transcript_10797/g.27824 Transcript_10797/m.27824 type:complete len:215 (-) Transcript_10797:4468-5112(-)